MTLFSTGGQNISSQFGMPLYGISNVPPFGGNYFFVDPNFGSDGNTGGPQDPFKTLTQAHSACLAGNNDVVFLTGNIGAGVSAYQSAPLVWSKNCTHLFGLCPPVKRGKQARIAITGTTAFSPLFSVTATCCWFSNLQFYHGFATDGGTTSYCVEDSGGRNMFDNCEILGFAGAGTAGNTGARALHVTGSTGESTYRNCVFGLDTVQRTVTNYTVEFAGGTPRNHFIDCEFEAWLSSGGAAACHLYTATSTSIDRYTSFDRCDFLSDVKSSGTAMTSAALLTAGGGLFKMRDCLAVGITHWEASISDVLYLNNPAINQTNPGVMLNQTT
jgi:hypothetical protein